jgi:poly(3-hydroxyalkanoate) synthetase
MQQRNDELSRLAEASALDLWRLCDELTLRQAIILYFGYDPRDNNIYDSLEVHGLSEPLEQAIFSGIKSGAITGTVVYIQDERANSWTSTINVVSFKSWLRGRGLMPKFFFPEGEKEAPDYLDKEHSRYAPKLAAAVNAWLSTKDEPKKSPKQTLERWLREHAAEYGLSDEDGKLNEQGIEDCAKIANWKLGGGAPKTS